MEMLSGDKSKENLDIHTLAAAWLFDVPYEEVTKLQRQIAKNRAFVWLYSTGETRVKVI